ncbi:MAG: aminopeptidase P family protein [Caldilineaceae bacterium]|nr:aminopeptidase P family protein [Caldilineaceae bacterium]
MSLTQSLPFANYHNKILPLRAQAEVRNRWLTQRLDEFLPTLLAREQVDMWIIVAREYNEDPVIMTFLPEPAMAARRRTILVFTRQADGSVERLTLDRYGHGDYYQKGWDPAQEDQFACLGRVVRERDPQRIGLNYADDFPFGDGLSHSEYGRVRAALGEPYAARVQSAERLCVGWLEHRIAPEQIVYPGLAQMAHALIAEAFSSRTIQPGITTTDDLVWWFRQQMHDLGLRTWFQPSVEIQAAGLTFDGPAGGGSHHARKVILPGDLLHCDVGFYYLGLATDHQQNAYVLKPGEDDAPEGLRILLAEGNRLQEIHMAAMQVGRTGNEVLHAALEQAKQEGLLPQIYSHPLGYHGHAAGPVIGLWDQQTGVPGRGDYEIFDHTCYSIELNAKKAIPEWDHQLVRMALEEDALLSNGQMRWLDGRQTTLHLIG